MTMRPGGAVGGVTSLASLGSVRAVTASLSGDTLAPWSRARTVNEYAVS